MVIHTFLVMPIMQNDLEGIFADIKTKLRVYSGLSKLNGIQTIYKKITQYESNLYDL